MKLTECTGNAFPCYFLWISTQLLYVFHSTYFVCTIQALCQIQNKIQTLFSRDTAASIVRQIWKFNVKKLMYTLAAVCTIGLGGTAKTIHLEEVFTKNITLSWSYNRKMEWMPLDQVRITLQPFHGCNGITMCKVI